MNSNYVQAFETKARWLKWLQKDGFSDISLTERRIAIPYERVLLTPDTHYMNSKFCSLVDHARLTVPDDLKFDISWTHSREGWLFLEEPFSCPNFVVNKEVITELSGKSLALKENIKRIGSALDIRISAIGWMPVANVTELADGRRFGEYGAFGDPSLDAAIDPALPKGYAGTAFLMFHDLGMNGFTPWSYFTLANGDKLIDRVHEFEATAVKEGGAYAKARVSEELHEIRWIYTAFYLMAQRLATEVIVPTERAVKRRAAREGRTVPDTIKVVSLRRLETAREKDPNAEKNPIEWNWQWEVRGHWRNQYYPATKEHHPVFVEAYIKGPDDKPLKNPGQKLFAAVR